MVGILTLPRTTIGKKVIMAVTGLIGIGFVFGHMYGNLKFFFGPKEFNAYAEGLREFGSPILTHSEPLWIVRLILLASVVLHVWSAWSLYQDSRRARSTPYSLYTTLHTNFAARYIRFGGTVILIFIIIHLMQFTWGVPVIEPDFIPGHVYHNVVVGFQSYYYLPAVFYLVAMLLLGFHLYHGTWSMFQTLGLNNSNYTHLWRGLALILAVVISVGFAIIPLAVILGYVSQ